MLGSNREHFEACDGRRDRGDSARSLQVQHCETGKGSLLTVEETASFTVAGEVVLAKAITSADFSKAVLQLYPWMRNLPPGNSALKKLQRALDREPFFIVRSFTGGRPSTYWWNEGKVLETIRMLHL